MAKCTKGSTSIKIHHIIAKLPRHGFGPRDFSNPTRPISEFYSQSECVREFMDKSKKKVRKCEAMEGKRNTGNMGRKDIKKVKKREMESRES